MKKYLTHSECAGRWPGVTLPVSTDLDNDRRGSVLLVVIGLLGMLLLVGIAFYSFASQEIASGQNYAEAAKEDDSGLSPEKLWAFALEQLIVGTNDPNLKQSALFGRRHALLTGILGRTNSTALDGFDITPFNGTGINLRYDTNGDPFVDQDYDGTPDADQSLLNINDSPTANNGVSLASSFPNPDVDYSAPDINSIALSYIGRGVDQLGNDVNTVIIPSFHRPQLLRSQGGPITDWSINQTAPKDTTKRVLRPHPNHKAFKSDGTISTLPRFLSSTEFNALGQTVQPFPFGSATNLQQGVWDLNSAVTPPVGSQSYSWDSDNDGDNVKEGIWMDLAFPLQALADGRLYVPLFSFTVIDADGLINLNLSGNQSGMNNLGLPLANGLPISRSNQGLSRSEISPEWALLTNPSSDPASTTQHNLFWNTPAGSISRVEMANIETLFLNIGRPEFTDTTSGTYSVPGGSGPSFEPLKYYPGRYGELELMERNRYTASGFGMAGFGDGNPANRDFTVMPKPGKSNAMFGSAMNPYAGDDDSDALLGHSRIDNSGYFFMGTSFHSLQSNLAFPSFIHPLDFNGGGLNLAAGTTGLRLQMSNSGLSVPSQWPYYSNGFSSPGTDQTGTGFINYLNAGTGNLLTVTNPSQLAQVDEADEIVSEWELASSNAAMQQDEVLGPDNMLELHGTDSDLTSINLQARIRNLLPYNFKLSQQAESIRKQFTVISHDRKNFGLSPFIRRGADLGDSDSDGNPEFPPTFIAPGTTSLEPFRQALRQLFFVEYNQSTLSNNLAQLRLNLNRLLVKYDTATPPIGAPVYRELTPHPISGLGNTPISASPTSWNADTPAGIAPVNDQEWWARYDRQRMARDIYVLLYTFGGGMDSTSYTVSNAGNALYTNEQLREMAQFAVNLVDELDRDDVITKFEYDKNLADGWNVTDNAYDTSDNSLPDRQVVYGVESQKLTFSEVLGIVSKQVKDSSNNGIDHPSTQVNDADGDRYYTYMELRNASPFSVDLSNGAWQIAVLRDDGPDGLPNTKDETDVVQLTPLRFSTSTNAAVQPGGLFTIGTRGGPAATDPNVATQNLPSVFRVDTTGAMAPDFTTAASVIAPLTASSLDLDLIPQTAGATNITTQFRLTDGSGPIPGAGTDVAIAGNFLYGTTGPVTGNVLNSVDPLIFVLRRRADLNRTMPVSYSGNPTDHVSQSNDNPWVEVDRITMTWKEFQLQQDTAADDMERATTVQAELKDGQSLISKERAQPFSRNLQEINHANVTAAPWQAHTVGGLNSNSPGSFSQVQLHFDRDFASTIDLLSVPLYGPDEVTRRVGQTASFNRQFSAPVPLGSDTTSYLAQERFLRPLHIENLTARLAGVPLTFPTVFDAATATTATTDVPMKDNRWYRILELLEVPTQSDSGVRTFPYALRTSGPINLNTIRTRGVLAGLIDDPDNPDNAAAPNPPYEGHLNPLYLSEQAMLIDTFEPSGTFARNWWLQFLVSRDGIDPLTHLVLPGTPQGRPFRSLTYAERSSNSLDDTILRTMPMDLLSATMASQFSDRRTLFEARTNGDRPSFGGGDAVDSMSKHRLLRKVANNSTTRSNVFAVWIRTRFFEAVEQPTGEVQIGAPIDGIPDHRGFFIVDRSLPEQAYNPNINKFDYRKFVQYRKTLQ